MYYQVLSATSKEPMQLPAKKSTRGFTLIELLVVITIIGVLTSLFVVNMVSVRQRAKDANIKSSLNELRTALRLYYNDYQNYPATLPAVGNTLSGPGGVVYMQEVPAYDDYAVLNNGDSFVVSIELENTSDTEICESLLKCGIEQKCEIGVSTTYYACSQ